MAETPGLAHRLLKNFRLCLDKTNLKSTEDSVSSAQWCQPSPAESARAGPPGRLRLLQLIWARGLNRSSGENICTGHLQRPGRSATARSASCCRGHQVSGSPSQQSRYYCFNAGIYKPPMLSVQSFVRLTGSA